MTPAELIAAVACTVPNAAAWAPELTRVMAKYEIDSPMRQAHFLSQVAHESYSLQRMKERANPGKIPGAQYEGRRDLGNVEPGDGPRFCGRGPIQFTGCANYTWLSKKTGVGYIEQPELLERIPDGAESAALYWTLYWTERTKLCDLNTLADGDSIGSITRRINGGTTGIEDRTRRLLIAKRALGLPVNR